MNGKNHNNSSLLYEEEQRMTVQWLWWLLVLIAVIIIATSLYGVYQQLVLGEPSGTSPVSDTALIIMTPFMILLGLSPVLLFKYSRLIVRVDSEKVHMVYRPFIQKKIPLSSIDECIAITFSPMRDHRGWGIRYSRKLRSHLYTIGGKSGVKITTRNGISMVISSERAEELARIINTQREKPVGAHADYSL